MKKILLYVVGGFFALMIILAIIYSPSKEERAAAAKAASEQAANDSLKLETERAQAKAQKEAEDLAFSKLPKKEQQRIIKEREEAAAAEVAKKDSIDKAALFALYPEKALELKIDSWELGGFGTVPVADFTIKNVWTKPAKDITVLWTFIGESGTEIGSSTKIYNVIIDGGKSRKFKKENLGFAPKQTSKLRGEVTRISD